MKYYTSIIRHKNQLLVRGVDSKKKDVFNKVIFQPSLFIQSDQANEVPIYHSVDGKPLYKMDFSSMSEATAFTKKYDDVENFNIYGNEKYVYQYISNEFKDVESLISSDLKIACIDIETECDAGFPRPELAEQKILLITMSVKNEYWVFGTGHFDVDSYKHEQGEKIHYYDCMDEINLLEQFLTKWNEVQPHILTGWNTKFFDIPYIINRAKKLLSEKAVNSISPFGIIKKKELNDDYGNPNSTYDIYGIELLDYLEVYKKWGVYHAQESYKLDYIAEVELGEKKLDYSEFDSLSDLYKKDWRKFVEYNIHDVRLVNKLDDKMKLFDLVIAMAYFSKVNISDVFSPLRTWDSIIYNHLKEKNIIIPLTNHETKDGMFMGAYVKDPQVGGHDWVMSFDLNSLYPHLIMQYSISPELFKGMATSASGALNIDNIIKDNLPKDMHKFLKESNVTICPNGAMFKRELGFLPELMDKLYNERKLFKKKMIEVSKEKESLIKKDNRKEWNILNKKQTEYDNKQMSMKILLNSAYGALGNQYFRWFDTRLAEAITYSGKLSIRWIEYKLNKFLNDYLKTTDIDFIIASDTDSIYIGLNFLVQYFKDKLKTKKQTIDFLDKFGEKVLKPEIDKIYQDLKETMNATQQKMVMGREVIADRAIWTAKKRYMMSVLDNEGVRYTEPKLKVMGIECVKSSTPSACRDKLKKSIEFILKDDRQGLLSFIEDFKSEYKKLPLEEISSPRSMSNIDKWKDTKGGWLSGCPIHVKGAILYNRMIDEYKLHNKYEKIGNGDKIKYIYLLEPNEFGNDSISFIKFPKEVKLQKLIDFDKQFDKTFKSTLNDIVKVINWSLDRTSNLEDLFG